VRTDPVAPRTLSPRIEYPWSSYRFNALGQTDDLITPHFEFHRLGTDDSVRQAAYRALFNQPISETQINEIRETTNKAWALGDSRFKERIQLQLARRVEPSPRGGDRKSAQFKINRV
jgi:putative transposase